MSAKRKATSSGRRRRPLSDAEREQRRERDRERLNDAIRALQSSEGWQRWLAIRRHNGLSRYSANNQFLLVMDAWARGFELRYVAGYRWWAENGYQVRKGERALYVLAPIVRKVEDEATGEKVRRVVGFRNAPVFDLAQVDAGPDALVIEPPATEPLSGDSHAECLPRLEDFAASIGVSVSYTEPIASRGAKGFYRHSDRLIAIGPDDPNAMVRTLLHELGHAIFASEFADARTIYGRAEEECIVESAGHIAACSAGLDTSGEAVAYVAGWSEEDKLSTVGSAALLVDEFASRLERALEPESIEPESADSDREAVPA